MNGLLEPGDAHARGIERDARLVILVLQPARALVVLDADSLRLMAMRRREPADMASTTGCRKSLSKTKPERRSRSVAIEAAAMAATGSNPRTKWSGQLIES